MEALAARVASHLGASSLSAAPAVAAGLALTRAWASQAAGHALAAVRGMATAAGAPAAGAGGTPAGTPSASATAAPSAAAAAPQLLLDELEDLIRMPLPPPPADLPALALPPHVLRDLRPPRKPYQLRPQLAQRPSPTPALYTPWTPTRLLQRRAKIARRMSFLVNVLEREHVAHMQQARPVPAFKAGDVLEVRMLVPEAERKVLLYRGVCIARYDKGVRSSFKIYNVYPESGGVVQHLPLYMPDLLGISVVGRIPVKQERLFYLLEHESSAYTFQTAVTQAK